VILRGKESKMGADDHQLIELICIFKRRARVGDVEASECLHLYEILAKDGVKIIFLVGFLFFFDYLI
jgi:hypothetical protein